MRRFGCLVMAALAAAALAGCHFRARGVDEWAGVVPDSVLGKASLQYYWRYPMPLNPGETVEGVWRMDENFYALTSSNRLIALDAAAGTYKWSYPAAAPGRKVFAPCHADGVVVPETGGIAAILNPPDLSRLKPFNAVIINTLSSAVMLNRQTGERVRDLDFTFADPANTAGSSDGSFFFVGTVQGRYHAVRLPDGLTEWTMGTNDMITARPVAYGRRLYVASQDGRFVCVDPQASDNRRIWMQTTDAPVTADFVVDARGCFVPSQDFKLYVYDNVAGSELWYFRAQGPLLEPVQVGRQTVLQYADRDRFYALDLASGRKRWDLPNGRLVLAAIDPNLYVLTPDRQLLAVNEMLGTVETALPMTGWTLFVPNASKPMIFAAARDGKACCIRPVGAGPLTPEMLGDRERAVVPATRPVPLPTSVPATAPAGP